MFLFMLVLFSNTSVVKQSENTNIQNTQEVHDISSNISNNIENVGYINEVIDNNGKGSVEFQNILLEQNPKLERSGCKLSKELPVANINVEYLIKNGNYIS